MQKSSLASGLLDRIEEQRKEVTELCRIHCDLEAYSKRIIREMFTKEQLDTFFYESIGQ